MLAPAKSSNMDSSGNGSSSEGNNLRNKLLVNTGTLALATYSGNPQTYTQIPNYMGLPLKSMDFLCTIIDTPGGTTAPVTPTSVETAIYELKITGQKTQIMDLRGTYFDFQNCQKMLNDNGIYVTATVPTIGSSSAVTTSFNFHLEKSIVQDEFPLIAELTPNTNASRAATLNGMTSSLQMIIQGNYERAQPVRSKIQTTNITVAASGQFNMTPSLPVGFYKKFLLNVGTDATLDSTNTFNVFVGTNHVLNNANYAGLNNTESVVIPNSAHIGGVFPLAGRYGLNGQGASLIGWQPYKQAGDVDMEVNFASAPTVGPSSNTARALMEVLY